jgi:hypothetical protein
MAVHRLRNGLLIASLLFLGGIASARAQTLTLVLDPASGFPGDPIHVSGEDWPADATVLIYFDASDPDPITTATTDPRGILSADFTVPTDRTPGTYKVLACNGCPIDPGVSLTTQFTLEAAPSASISLDPEVGAPGDSIAVTGTGWTNGATVDVYFDLNDPTNGIAPLVSPVADRGGNFSESFAVPDRPDGSYIVLACQDCLFERGPSATTEFTVLLITLPPPTLSLDPSEGSPGDTISVLGTIWLPQATVQVYLGEQDPSSGIGPVASTLTGSDGIFSTTFEVPADRTEGRYTVLACQDCGGELDRRQTAPFTLTALLPPAIAVDPTIGSPGDAISITGTGWAPQAEVSVYFDQEDPQGGVDPIATATADADGNLSADFIVPDDREAGTFNVLVCESCAPGEPSQATAVFTLLAVASSATITLDPPQGSPGEIISVTGTGWTPFATVSVFFDRQDLLGGVEPIASAAADADGTLSTTFVMPQERDAGSYDVLACEACDDPNAPSAVALLSLTSSSTLSNGSGGLGVLPIILVPIVLILAGGLAFLLRKVAPWRRPGWERLAENEDRTEPCQGRRWYCRRGEADPNPSLRKIGSVAVTIRPQGEQEPAKVLGVEGGAVDVLNQALMAVRAELLRRPANTLVESATGLVWYAVERETARGIPQDVEFTLDIEGSEISCPYTLFHCERERSTRVWRERASWTGTISFQGTWPVTTISIGTPAAEDPEAVLPGAFMAALEAVAQGKVATRIKGSHKLDVPL